MLRDDYNQLLKLFREGAEGKVPNLDAIFSQSVEFFNHLKSQIESGTPDEKQEAMKMMSDLYTQMMAETTKIAEKSGLSEEQLAAYAENPSNFTPEQWKAIQDSKQKIGQAGQDLAHVIEEINKGSLSEAEKKETTSSRGAKKSKKSQWMRS
jgi:hypothetical protein